MKALPIESILPNIIEALTHQQCVAIHAPPGAGKSTMVPGALLKSGLFSEGLIVLLEPRRAAARSVAKRIAQLMNEPLGKTVGYQVRFEGKRSAQTRILVITEGLLTRWLQQDPFLEGIAAVVVDEFHERSVHVDLSLAFLKEVLTVREDLRVVVMSATFDAQAVADYLAPCSVLKCEGRIFPVDISYEGPRDRLAPLEAVTRTIRRVLKEHSDGHVLVFLPGAPEIRRVAQQLVPLASRLQIQICPLYGALSAKEQDLALAPSEQLKVILSTNLAETSLTIEGVTSVIDSGLRKVKRYDGRRGFERLETVMISQASATQRAGRAGRTQRGRAFRIWSESEQRSLKVADEAQLRLVDLSGVLLQVLGFHPGDLTDFDFFEAPSESAIEQAIDQLRHLGLLEEDGQSLTELGQLVSQMPVAPRLGLLLLEAGQRNMPQVGAMMAALLSEQEILGPELRNNPPTVDSDLLWQVGMLQSLLQGGAQPHKIQQWGLKVAAVKQVLRVYQQLLSVAKSVPGAGSKALVDERLLLLPAFVDRLCLRRQSDSADGAMVGGRGVTLHRSGVREAPLFLALQVEGGRRGNFTSGRVNMASSVPIKALSYMMPERIKKVEGAEFDEQKQSVAGVARTYFDDLCIGCRRGVKVDELLLADTLAREAGERFTQVFKPSGEAQSLLYRLRLAQLTFPEEDWFDVRDEVLKTWLPGLCFGRRKLSELGAIDWFSALKSRVPYQQLQSLEQYFPEHLTVPSGRRASIDYAAAFSPQKMPILSAQVQELFGWAQTPVIGRGRVQLLLHILAPNKRPTQITTDLKNFWDHTYIEVRKELRQRYPKHSWPEDPWTAKAERRPRRRRSN